MKDGLKTEEENIGKIKVDQIILSTNPFNNYVLTSDSEGNATWAVSDGGVTAHNLLNNLDYASAGHAGFSPDTHDHGTGTDSNLVKWNTSTTLTNSNISEDATNITIANRGLIVDISTLIVDDINHRVGIGTATPTSKIDVDGGGVIDFFGGRFNLDGDAGTLSILGLTMLANDNANFFTGKLIVNNVTGVTTISDLSATASALTLEKDQNAVTQFGIRNTSAGASTLSTLKVDNGTYAGDVLMTGTGYTGFPNSFVIITDAVGGMVLESDASDMYIETVQEVDGNGFNVNITASDGFDSGIIARNGGNINLTAGLAVNGGTNGGIKIPVIKFGATQAGAGAAANEPWKTSGHATLPDNVLLIGV